MYNFLFEHIDVCLTDLENLVENQYDNFNDFFVMSHKFNSLFGEVMGYGKTLTRLCSRKCNNIHKKRLYELNIIKRLNCAKSKYMTIFSNFTEE